MREILCSETPNKPPSGLGRSFARHCDALGLEVPIKAERKRLAALKWAKNNRERVAETGRKWREANPGATSESQRKRRAAHPEKYALSQAKYRKSPEKAREQAKRCYDKHREEMKTKGRLWKRDNREWIRAYEKVKYRTDFAYRFSLTARKAMNNAFRGIKKSASSEVLLGCSFPEGKKHVESQFRPGMTWENHGSVWELDHKRPFCHFPDLSKPEQQRLVCHFSNLQPLFIEEHAAKTAEDIRVAPATRKNFS